MPMPSWKLHEKMGLPEAAFGYLGLAARAGAVVAGTQNVRDAGRRGRLELALVAGDASSNSRDKLEPLFRARGIPFLVWSDREGLGAALGRGYLSAVGITDAAMARQVGEAIGASAVEPSSDE